MTDVMKFESSPSDVSAVLTAVMVSDGEGLTLSDPGEQLEDLAVVVCETMPIAMVKHLGEDKFQVTHLACYSPTHGSHPKMAALQEKMMGIARADKVGAQCIMCGGRSWLPVGGEEARTGSAFAISMGIFRGVILPQTDELAKLGKVAMEKAFAKVLEHPIMTRIKSDLAGEGNDSATDAEH